MAFSFSGYSRASVGVNEPIITLEGGTVVGTPQSHWYQGGSDAFETIIAPDYFLPGANTLFKLGDIIYIDSTHPILGYKIKGIYYVDNVTVVNGVATGITVASYGYSLLTRSLTPAEVIAMNAAPVVLLPASSNNVYLANEVFYDLQWAAGNVQYAGGGAVVIQYNNTANAGGIAATGTVAANGFTPAATTVSSALGVVVPINARANIANVGLFITNGGGAAFAAGNSPVKLNLWFKTLRVG